MADTNTKQEHWTQAIRRENEALREALKTALCALTDIPQSRLDKERIFPHDSGEAGMAYRTCAEESMTRAREAVSAVASILVEAGVH